MFRFFSFLSKTRLRFVIVTVILKLEFAEHYSIFLYESIIRVVYLAV